MALSLQDLLEMLDPDSLQAHQALRHKGLLVYLAKKYSDTYNTLMFIKYRDTVIIMYTKYSATSATLIDMFTKYTLPLRKTCLIITVTLC